MNEEWTLGREMEGVETTADTVSKGKTRGLGWRLSIRTDLTREQSGKQEGTVTWWDRGRVH